MPIKLENGINIRADLRDDFWFNVAYKGFHEKDTHDFFTSYLEPGDTVIDVGAHRGSLSTVAAKCVGSKGTVHSFDVDNMNLSSLKHAIKINKLDNIVVHQLALGNSIGEMKFLRPKNSWGAFNSNAGIAGERSNSSALGDLVSADTEVEEFVCRASTLDNEFGSKLERLDLLKIDVDGPELDVAKGATELIKKFHPAILSEASIFARDRSIPINENLAFFHNLGYTVYGTMRTDPQIRKINSPDEPWLKKLIEDRADLDLFCYYPGTRDHKWNHLEFIKNS